MGAVHWLILALMLALGGAGFAVQTLVAQAYGGRRRRRASHAMWMGLWGALLTTPAFLLVAWGAPALAGSLRLTPEIQHLASEYWWPRVLGGSLAVALWAVLSFYNGVGRPGVSLLVNAFVAIVNAALNEVLMFRLDMGIAGAAWASTVSVSTGLVLSLALVLARSTRGEFATHRTWRLRWLALRSVFALGIPTGMMVAFDVTAFGAFQLLQTQLGAVAGAATQITTMLTSIAFMPAVGIGMAGTTLVGQSIGAGDKRWAYVVGNATIRLAVLYMTAIAILLALLAPWVVPLFVAVSDPRAGEVAALGVRLLWIAACYQFFDGLNLGAGFCLRGAGDVKFPAIMLAVLAWLVYVPLAHTLAFDPGQGWIRAAPSFGYGAAGGWLAAVIYVALLGTMLYLRWRSRAWQRIRLA